MHGIPSRLLNSLVYANNMLICMFMVVSLLYRHPPYNWVIQHHRKKQNKKKHAAKDVSLQKSKKNKRIPSLRDAVPERLLLFTEQPPSVWAKFTSFGAGILGAKTSEKTAIKIKKRFPQFDGCGFTNGKKNEKNKQHMPKNIPGASRYYNKNHGKIIENINLQQLQETSILINRSLGEVVPLGWLWANVVRILVHLGHCGFGLRIENCGLGGIPLSQCSYGPMSGCKWMFYSNVVIRIITPKLAIVCSKEV